MSKDDREGSAREIIIIPVDANDKALLHSDIKIEEVDAHFRRVQEVRGLEWKLAPGTYKVKIMLPSLHMKTFTLRVTPEETVYRLTLGEATTGKVRGSSRIPVSLPVSYRGDNGNWVSTQSINISTAGLCLVRKSSSDKSDNLYIRLFLPISSIPLECPARICWTKDQEAQMGLELFLTPNMKASLGNWLSKYSA
jgi:hypothetical protein